MIGKKRRALLAGVGVVMAAGSLSTASATAAMASASPAPTAPAAGNSLSGEAADKAKAQKSAGTPIYTLGFSHRPNSIDSEFRYDGVITVPKGQKIQGMGYSSRGDDNVDTIARQVSRGKGGMGQEFEVVSTESEGNSDKITFTLRGDFGPGGNGCPTTHYPVAIAVQLMDGSRQTVRPVMDMRRFDRCDGSEGGGRPVARLPWDNAWSSPDKNSQDGWGFITESGKVPGNKFIIDASNPRHGSGLPCDVTDEVYYQWVKSDGTPSKLTPEPKKLEVVPHGNDRAKKIEFTQTTDFTADGAGYYKLLAWPQAKSSKGQVCNASWNKDKIEDAFQVGSVFYDKADDVDFPLTNPAVVGGATALAALAGGGFWLTSRRGSKTS
ncbi:hypothetical protein AB0C51_01930 [Streptomyces pathocidini]|uniref:hypothetical protein n=1 Tax=Streptomyces pathocidini TaxID=1650571 RepID=UPI003403ED88